MFASPGLTRQVYSSNCAHCFDHRVGWILCCFQWLSDFSPTRRSETRMHRAQWRMVAGIVFNGVCVAALLLVVCKLPVLMLPVDSSISSTVSESSDKDWSTLAQKSLPHSFRDSKWDCNCHVSIASRNWFSPSVDHTVCLFCHCFQISSFSQPLLSCCSKLSPAWQNWQLDRREWRLLQTNGRKVVDSGIRWLFTAVEIIWSSIQIRSCGRKTVFNGFSSLCLICFCPHLSIASI